jgi:hypothetical protein
LYVALEMGMAKWKVCSTIGVAQKPRTKDVPARRMDLVLEEIARAKARFGLPAEATVHVGLSLESGVWSPESGVRSLESGASQFRWVMLPALPSPLLRPPHLVACSS